MDTANSNANQSPAADPLSEWIDRAARQGVTFTNAISAVTADKLAVRPVAVTVDVASLGAADARSATLEHLAALARNADRTKPASAAPAGHGTDALRVMVAALRAENARLQASLAEREDEATVLAGMLGLREKQVADLRQENAVLSRIVVALKASLNYAKRQGRKDAAPAEPVLGDPEWTAPMSLLPRGMR